MKYCTKCGHKMEDEDTFCPSCGARVSDRKDISVSSSPSYPSSSSSGSAVKDGKYSVKHPGLFALFIIFLFGAILELLSFLCTAITRTKPLTTETIKAMQDW